MWLNRKKGWVLLQYNSSIPEMQQERQVRACFKVLNPYYCLDDVYFTAFTHWQDFQRQHYDLSLLLHPAYPVLLSVRSDYWVNSFSATAPLWSWSTKTYENYYAAVSLSPNTSVIYLYLPFAEIDVGAQGWIWLLLAAMRNSVAVAKCSKPGCCYSWLDVIKCL